jgi:NAD(P)-dependent dehydrogenase (short-subunit alcohol dehydrogenase family)
MIGSLVGSWMTRQQVAKIVLLGRSGRPGADSGSVVQLASNSASAITMARCDASSAAEVAAVAEAATGSRRLQSVVLSGGVLADAAIPNQALRGIRAVFAPKPCSAQLWQLPAGVQPCQGHLVFSSVAALLGSPGQANYSAANACLDAMAQGWQSQVRRSWRSGGPGANHLLPTPISHPAHRAWLA